MLDYSRCKFEALLLEPQNYSHLRSLEESKNFPRRTGWWQKNRDMVEEIASSSDQVNLKIDNPNSDEGVLIKYLINGLEYRLKLSAQDKPLKISPSIEKETDLQKMFQWLGRFFSHWCVGKNCFTALHPLYLLITSAWALRTVKTLLVRELKGFETLILNSGLIVWVKMNIGKSLASEGFQP